eukprot:764889-Hanusia_phi.AAC.6
MIAKRNLKDDRSNTLAHGGRGSRTRNEGPREALVQRRTASSARRDQQQEAEEKCHVSTPRNQRQVPGAREAARRPETAQSPKCIREGLASPGRATRRSTTRPSSAGSGMMISEAFLRSHGILQDEATVEAPPPQQLDEHADPNTFKGMYDADGNFQMVHSPPAAKSRKPLVRQGLISLPLRQDEIQVLGSPPKRDVYQSKQRARDRQQERGGNQRTRNDNDRLQGWGSSDPSRQVTPTLCFPQASESDEEIQQILFEDARSNLHDGDSKTTAAPAADTNCVDMQLAEELQAQFYLMTEESAMPHLDQTSPFQHELDSRTAFIEDSSLPSAVEDSWLRAESRRDAGTSAISGREANRGTSDLQEVLSAGRNPVRRIFTSSSPRIEHATVSQEWEVGDMSYERLLELDNSVQVWQKLGLKVDQLERLGNIAKRETAASAWIRLRQTARDGNFRAGISSMRVVSDHGCAQTLAALSVEHA